ncbi:MAG: VOC family protein [Bradyrhizobium sp.]|uniref:VOC family protein n=1 Tax=Bradyrhizobium sp. TaxID=376 RepID=UPI001D526A3C|nr:VOC family protein [Bradyrhizobium sp.]MBV9559804.1 VOC family protein [Bradyrhizobium sp.]
MQQQICVITLATQDAARSRRFYVDGFGWRPVFENGEIIFFQMNGLMLGIWQKRAMEADMRCGRLCSPGAFSLAHNVARKDDVDSLVQLLVAAGGRVLRAADAPNHGGYRGYVADPDDHAWEIAWNPAWTIDQDGLVRFGT